MSTKASFYGTESDDAPPRTTPKFSRCKSHSAITVMKEHLDEISEVMETIQVSTNNIDDEVSRCERIINDTFDAMTSALEDRRQALLRNLKKTAKNKKLNLLLQQNELKHQRKDTEKRLSTIEQDEIPDIYDDEEYGDDRKDLEDELDVQSPSSILLTNFDLHFNKAHSKQLIQVRF